MSSRYTLAWNCIRTVDSAVEEKGTASYPAKCAGSTEPGRPAADYDCIVGWKIAIGDCEDWGGSGKAGEYSCNDSECDDGRHV